MDEITQVKIKFRKEQWIKLIAECQTSGLGIKTWCQQNNVKESSYFYWLKQIRKDACAQQLPVPTNDSKPIKFAKLPIDTRTVQSLSTVTIHLPIATVEVREEVSQDTLETVLQALKNIC